jgi:hypothetical protein
VRVSLQMMRYPGTYSFCKIHISKILPVGYFH